MVGIYDFVVSQTEGYSNLENITEEFKAIRERFIRLKGDILQYISQGQTDKNNWDQLLNWLLAGTPPAFTYNSPETIFLLRTAKERPEYYPGAYEYLTGATGHPSQKEYLTGYLLAYEFSNKDFSEIAERTDTEKKSITSITSDFQTSLGEAEAQVVDVISKSNEKVEEHRQLIDDLKAKKEKFFDDWFKTSSTAFALFDSESQKKIALLEELYREKLKLEAPAQYWRNRAQQLRKEGNWWLVGLVASLIIGVVILFWSLSEISNGMLMKIFDSAGTSIKWSIVFITIVSFLAFAIKIFSKLTFSSFHLVRDAEEREQLTYVYLALQKEKGIDETERHLIMQSLFSRADTGLLKDDSSPTMPGGIAEKMMGK